MTEPVARAASPRRTVRVAAALVAGQAVLCAVIGWVTFGSSGPPPSVAGRAVDAPTVPPIMVPTASMAIPLPPSPAPGTTATATRRAQESTRPARKPPPKPVATPGVRTTTVPERPTTVATTTAETRPAVPPSVPPVADPAATPAPMPTEVQQEVVAGEPCDPPGALGETVDDVEVSCVRGPDGRPSWQIN